MQNDYYGNLRNSWVTRGGLSIDPVDWKDEKTDVSVTSEAILSRSIIITTSISSKGGGETGISINISQGDFPKILEAMAAAMKGRGLEDIQ